MGVRDDPDDSDTVRAGAVVHARGIEDSKQPHES